MSEKPKKSSSYRALQQKSSTNSKAKNPTNASLKRDETQQNLQIEIINDIDGCKAWIPKLKSYVLFFLQNYKIVFGKC